MACPMFIPRSLFQTNCDVCDRLTNCDQVAACCDCANVLRQCGWDTVGIGGGYEMDFA